MVSSHKSVKQKSEQKNIAMDEHLPLPAVRLSDELTPNRGKWRNKQRVLVFAARGINHRDRHLMRDIKILMPHHKSESKMERSKTLSVVNEICETKHCNKSILFEGRRKRDLYVWFSNVSTGPSAKFLVENIHTMAELKMTGNCLRGSRALLSFNAKFDEIPHLILLKELFTQIFTVPNNHPKSQPFIDHVFTFSYVDNRIWFRNFQILSEDGGLSEIGPRFVMNPIKIFDNSFSGNPIWENPNYVSPSRQRQLIKKVAQEKYVNRIEQKVHQKATRPQHAYDSVKHAELFDGQNAAITAKQISEKRRAAKVSELSKKNKSNTPLKNKIVEKKMKAVKNVICKKKGKAGSNKLLQKIVH